MKHAKKIKDRLAICSATLAAVFCAGAAIAAERAAPGDMLYPIKIGVTERAEEVAARGGVRKAEVQAKFAVRRVEEAEKLLAENRGSEEAFAGLAVRFAAHADKARKGAKELSEKNDVKAAARISADLEVALASHREILENTRREKPATEKFISELTQKLTGELKLISLVREEEDAKIFSSGIGDATGAAESALLYAENKIEEAKRVNDRRKHLPEDTRVRAHEHVKAAVAAVAEGKAKMEVPAYDDAFALFRKAAREAEAAMLFSER